MEKPPHLSPLYFTARRLAQGTDWPREPSGTLLSVASSQLLQTGAIDQSGVVQIKALQAINVNHRYIFKFSRGHAKRVIRNR